MSVPDFTPDPGGGFSEDAPRPPVPGEEGELVSAETGRPPSHGGFFHSGEALKAEATPRRPDLDLGYEPEGSASPTPPALRWAGSLHSLLDDRDGTQLFRSFLREEGCADLLDFWFACSGFRKLAPGEGSEEKRLKLARAIYKKYVLHGAGVVARRVKPATKSFIRDCVLRQLVDPAAFDQAQTEVQAAIEEHSYPLFLKSDIYLEYARSGGGGGGCGGGESPKGPCGEHSPEGNGKSLPGYLPTLNEDEEWKGEGTPEGKGKGGVCRVVAEGPRDPLLPPPSGCLTQTLRRETAVQQAAPGAPPSASSTAAVAPRRYSEGREFRPSPWREPVHPYYVNTGFALAPAASANDSEQHSMSSDADTMSLTDSSVDGIPPYRLRKQHRREMQESAKANGRVPLPHIPRTYRMPKDIHVEPQKFAAELIHRLEEVLRDREAEAKLEERLKRVRAEEEGEELEMPLGPCLGSHKVLLPHFGPRCYSEAPPRDAHEENPESILDEHVQRVMKTPGCQSPKPRSPDSGLATTPGKPALHGPMTAMGPSLPLGHGKHAGKVGPRLEGAGLHHHKHVFHHAAHHHGPLKAKEPPPAEAEGPGGRGGGAFGWGLEGAHKPRLYGESACLDPAAYSSKAGLLSKRSTKKGEGGKGDGYEVPGSPEDVERNQKILQWIIEGEKEISRHKKTGHSSSGVKKQLGHELVRPASVERPVALHPWVSAQLRNVVQPSHPFIQDPTMPPNPAPNPLTQLEEARRRLEEEEKRTGKVPGKQRGKTQKRPPPAPQPPCDNIVVAYYFCGEPIPYRTLVKGRVVTLGQFKELLTKKGNYRYYFKKVSDEFDCGVVFEEVREDEAVLPIFEEKIIGKVEKID
ncbi:axin-1 isoform X3 [Anolis carolinensis]|uniref:Axin-1 n=1 Tax=Anolis carolinensis TaxID=28377 RepID=H9GM79_ANOCA|nr:PREDICTED: axin-1 isoform X2 [Anolis carolinensis]|eukprot:XP_008122767.1 PREDICTED: axin-1 isoform X2 [Anolis carolinensis]